MIVQSYFVTENQEAFSEPEEWLEKVKTLGLEGQVSLMGDGEKSPIPFQFVDGEWSRIIRTLCRLSEDITAYGKTPIPMEALGLVWTAQNEGYFDRIMVYYDAQDPDPFIIGQKGDKYSSDEYLIARFGEDKATKDELRERAIEKWIDREKANLQKIQSNVKQVLDDLESSARSFMVGGSHHLPHIYWSP